MVGRSSLNLTLNCDDDDDGIVVDISCAIICCNNLQNKQHTAGTFTQVVVWISVTIIIFHVELEIFYGINF